MLIPDQMQISMMHEGLQISQLVQGFKRNARSLRPRDARASHRPGRKARARSVLSSSHLPSSLFRRQQHHLRLPPSIQGLQPLAQLRNLEPVKNLEGFRGRIVHLGLAHDGHGPFSVQTQLMAWLKHQRETSHGREGGRKGARVYQKT